MRFVIPASSENFTYAILPTWIAFYPCDFDDFFCCLDRFKVDSYQRLS